VALVVLQLVLVCVVLAGSRDQDLMQQRQDTARAFYAVDAGLHLAIREVMSGVDEDGDGAIGSVSADGDSATDPRVDGARVSVTRSLEDGLTSLLTTGESGLARRVSDTRGRGVIGGNPQTVLGAFGRGGSGTPRYSAWTGSAWAASAAMPALGAEAKWVRMKICPTRNETTFIAETLNKRVAACFFDGSSWGPMTVLSTDTGGTNDRPEDIAYEQLSSDALCVYWKGTSGRFGYRVYNGATFAPEQALSSPFTTECDFATLYPRPGTDDVMLIAADGIAGGTLVASHWDGSGFGAWFTLEATLETNNNECYGMAFEAQTGRGLAVYCERGKNHPRYRTWTPSGWSEEDQLPNLESGRAQWIKLAADPTSNRIVAAIIDDEDVLSVNVWDGSRWEQQNTELESDTGGHDRQRTDVIFERGTGRAMIVYAQSGQRRIRYRTYDGSWSAEQQGPDLGTTVEIPQLSRGFVNGEVFVGVSDTSRRLHMMRWDGAVLSPSTVVENTLSGWPQYYSFALPEPTVAPHPRVKAWSEVSP
jgi:hypothetical protein